VRVEVHPLAEGLHHSHHPGPNLLARARGQHFTHGGPCCPAKIAKQLTVAKVSRRSRCRR
jgi:hypothetical protein